MKVPSLAEVRRMDEADPLRSFRRRFALPPGVAYLDGNSLGALPIATRATLADAVDRQWGEGLVRSWNEHDWIGAPQRIGGKIARLIGAHEDEVIVADSTSINIFKLLAAAATRHADRPKIVAESGNFPTDLHIAAGTAALMGRKIAVVPPGGVGDALGPDTAAVVLPHVHYRSGERIDMAALNARARAHDVPIVWDLSHSAGAVPLDLTRDGAELAVGCGYKYLNGGPGAPAFLYVARHLQAALSSPLQGWLGHAAPFDFSDDYRPAAGVSRFLAGTPPILSLLALETGVDLMAEAEPAALFAKAEALGELFLALMDAKCAGLKLASPREPHLRGSHLAFAHPHAYAIVQAAIAEGVIGDFRTPNVARFGLTPLYTGFEDVWRAVEVLAGIMAQEKWRDPRHARRSQVT